MAEKQSADLKFKEQGTGFAGGGKVGDTGLAGGGKISRDGDEVQMHFDQADAHLKFKVQGDGLTGGGKVGDQGVCGGGTVEKDGTINVHLARSGGEATQGGNS